MTTLHWNRIYGFWKPACVQQTGSGSWQKFFPIFFMTAPLFIQQTFQLSDFPELNGRGDGLVVSQVGSLLKSWVRFLPSLHQFKDNVLLWTWYVSALLEKRMEEKITLLFHFSALTSFNCHGLWDNNSLVLTCGRDDSRDWGTDNRATGPRFSIIMIYQTRGLSRCWPLKVQWLYYL